MAFTPFVSETLLDRVRRIIADCAVYRNIRQLHQYGRPSAIFPRRGTRDSAIRVRCGKCCAYWVTCLTLQGFEYHDTAAILKDALDAENLPSKLNKPRRFDSKRFSDNLKPPRARGRSRYLSHRCHRAPFRAVASDQPCRRACRACESEHIGALGLQDGQTAIAKQNGTGMSVMVNADAGLPENVVHLPLHTENAALGALMDTIELAGA